MISKVHVWYVANPWRMHPPAWSELHYGHSGMNGIHRWVDLYYRFEDETPEEGEKRWQYFVESLGDVEWDLANPGAPRTIMVMGLHLEADQPEEAALERRRLNEVLQRCEADEEEWRIAILAAPEAPHDQILQILHAYAPENWIEEHNAIRADANQAVKYVIQDGDEMSAANSDCREVVDRALLKEEFDVVCAKLGSDDGRRPQFLTAARVERVHDLLSASDPTKAAALNRRLAIGLALADTMSPYCVPEDSDE